MFFVEQGLELLSEFTVRDSVANKKAKNPYGIRLF
jgi:hypothetical protein